MHDLIIIIKPLEGVKVVKWGQAWILQFQLQEKKNL